MTTWHDGVGVGKRDAATSGKARKREGHGEARRERKAARHHKPRATGADQTDSRVDESHEHDGAEHLHPAGEIKGIFEGDRVERTEELSQPAEAPTPRLDEVHLAAEIKCAFRQSYQLG